MSETVVVSTQLDDTSSNVTYAGTGWTYHTNQGSIYHLFDNSDTFSADQGATATLQFYGNAIEYWGNQGPYHGPCKITLDGTDVATINSNAAADDVPILLYSNNHISLGDHTLVITVLGSAYPSVCEVDRFVVNVTSSVSYTSVYAYTGPGSTPTGGSVPSASMGSIADNGGNGYNNNNNNGNSNKSSSPPVAAIAGAVGGVAAIAILLLVWWWYRRSKRNQPNTMAALKKKNTTDQVKPFLADPGLVSPSTLEKNAFNSGRPPFTNQPASYASSSPPPSTYPTSSPPPSTVGYYPFAPVAASVPPTSVGHPSPPGSPQPNMRPMSTISAAPSASYYSSAPVTVEGGGYPVPTQPVPTSTIAPVWATPTPSTAGYQAVPTEPSPSPSPAPAPVPAPVAAPIVATDAGPVVSAAGAYAESQRPEKARYTGSQAPPEKARYTGTSSSAGQSSGGASSSAAPTVNTTAPAASASGQPSRDDTMSPVVPEAPPPAYQI